VAGAHIGNVRGSSEITLTPMGMRNDQDEIVRLVIHLDVNAARRIL